MLQLKAVYTLPSTVVPVSNWALNPAWISEIDDLEYRMSEEIEKKIDAAGRLVIRRLVEKHVDHSRVVFMHTLWFDGKPVMLTQDAGRSADDHHRRWITDRDTYVALCCYLREMLTTEENLRDLADPEAMVYEEEIFCFYNHDFAPEFGYQCDPVTPGYEPYDEAPEFLPGTPKGMILVTAREGCALPEYVRRGEYVMKKERMVTEEDLASNPKVKEVCAEDGYTQMCWYRESPRPENTPVLSI